MHISTEPSNLKYKALSTVIIWRVGKSKSENLLKSVYSTGNLSVQLRIHKFSDIRNKYGVESVNQCNSFYRASFQSNISYKYGVKTN